MSGSELTMTANINSEKKKAVTPATRRSSPRRWPWLLAAATLLGGGAALWQSTRPAPLPEVPISRTQRGTLTRTVTGVGQVRSEASAQLRFLSSGKVSEVLVKVGDRVQKGQLLARLDSTAQERELAAALAAVRSSRAEVSRAEAEAVKAAGEVERLRGELPKAGADVSRAQAEVERAAAEHQRTRGDVAKAEAELARARAELQKARQTAGDAGHERQRTVDNAELALASASAALSTAEDHLKLQSKLQAAGSASPLEVRTAQNERDEAARKIRQAQNELSRARNASATASAASAVTQAEAGVRVAQTALTQAQMAAGNRAGLEQAQAGVLSARTGQKQAHLAVRQAANGVTLAQAGLRQARANLEAALLKADEQRRALAGLKLYAPASGVVSAVNVVAGGAQPNDPAIELTDPSRLYLEVPFDETRSTNLKVGQSAQVRFDALPDRLLTGTVQRLDPAAQITGQVARLKTRIALDAAQVGAQIRPGFTAQATVTTLKQDGAVLVPLEATREEGGTVSVWTLRPDAKGGQVGEPPITGTAHRVTIRVQARSANQAAVSGVQAGEWLMSPYPEGLTEGQPVRGVQAVAAGPGAGMVTTQGRIAP